MLDIGWTEMAIIALVALVVIGPKDLPKAMRGVAKWVRKARSLSREFQSGLDEMIREAELDDAKKSIESVGRYRVDELVEKEVDPTGSVKRDLKDVEDTAKKTAGKDTASGGSGSSAAATAGAAAASTAAADSTSEAATTAEAGEAPAKKGRRVTHPAKKAPGNSVKPPSEGVESSLPAREAASDGAATTSGGAKPADARKAPAKRSTAKAASTGSATKSGGSKSAAAKSGGARSGGAKAAPKTAAGTKASAAKASGTKAPATKSATSRKPAAGKGTTAKTTTAKTTNGPASDSGKTE